MGLLSSEYRKALLKKASTVVGGILSGLREVIENPDGSISTKRVFAVVGVVVFYNIGLSAAGAVTSGADVQPGVITVFIVVCSFIATMCGITTYDDTKIQRFITQAKTPNKP